MRMNSLLLRPSIFMNMQWSEPWIWHILVIMRLIFKKKRHDLLNWSNPVSSVENQSDSLSAILLWIIRR